MLDETLLTSIVIGLVSSAKTVGFPAKFAPILSLLLGVVASVAFMSADLTIAESVFKGIVIGLTASGLYSGVKAMVKTEDTVK